jgi:hypothetical protein
MKYFAAFVIDLEQKFAKEIRFQKRNSLDALPIAKFCAV